MRILHYHQLLFPLENLQLVQYDYSLCLLFKEARKRLFGTRRSQGVAPLGCKITLENQDHLEDHPHQRIHILSSSDIVTNIPLITSSKPNKNTLERCLGRTVTLD